MTDTATRDPGTLDDVDGALLRDLDPEHGRLHCDWRRQDRTLCRHAPIVVLACNWCAWRRGLCACHYLNWVIQMARTRPDDVLICDVCGHQARVADQWNLYSIRPLGGAA